MAVIAIDFDGVVHRYARGWHDGTIYDPPMPGAIDALVQLHAAGHRLILHTARVRDPQQRPTLDRWLAWHLPEGVFDEVTATKPAAHVYLDDRGLRFRNWPQALSDLDRLLALQR